MENLRQAARLAINSSLPRIVGGQYGFSRWGNGGIYWGDQNFIDDMGVIVYPHVIDQIKLNVALHFMNRVENFAGITRPREDLLEAICRLTGQHLSVITALTLTRQFEIEWPGLPPTQELLRQMSKNQMIHFKIDMTNSNPNYWFDYAQQLSEYDN